MWIMNPKLEESWCDLGLLKDLDIDSGKFCTWMYIHYYYGDICSLCHCVIVCFLCVLVCMLFYVTVARRM